MNEIWHVGDTRQIIILRFSIVLRSANKHTCNRPRVIATLSRHQTSTGSVYTGEPPLAKTHLVNIGRTLQLIMQSVGLASIRYWVLCVVGLSVARTALKVSMTHAFPWKLATRFTRQ